MFMKREFYSVYDVTGLKDGPVKSLIETMIQPDKKSRPSMQRVVDQLRSIPIGDLV